MKKIRTIIHWASTLYTSLLVLRWGIWLLLQIPPVLTQWQAFLNTAPGQAVATQFTSGILSAVPWDALINTLLTGPVMTIYLLLCALGWLKSRFPTHLLINTINQVRNILARPAGQQVIHRNYLRVFCGGHEHFFDLTKERHIEIPGTTLNVTLEGGGATLRNSDDFIRLLPERQIVAMDGMELEYIPFTRRTTPL